MTIQVAQLQVTDVTNIILVVITAVYVVLTYLLLRESQNTRKIAASSEVIADVEADEGILKFVVRNIGRSPARDISIEIYPPLLDLSGNDVSSYAKMGGLGVGQSRHYLLNAGPAFFSKGVPTQYSATLRWQDQVMGGRVHKYAMDLSSYREALVQHHPNRAIVDALKEMRKDLGQIRKSIGEIPRVLELVSGQTEPSDQKDTKSVAESEAQDGPATGPL